MLFVHLSANRWWKRSQLTNSKISKIRVKLMTQLRLIYKQEILKFTSLLFLFLSMFASRTNNKSCSVLIPHKIGITTSDEDTIVCFAYPVIYGWIAHSQKLRFSPTWQLCFYCRSCGVVQFDSLPSTLYTLLISSQNSRMASSATETTDSSPRF